MALESPYARQAAETLICVVAEQAALIAALRAALVEIVDQYEAVALLWEPGTQSREVADSAIRTARALLERTKP